ncbi:MAG: FHA domain-containing protein [Clostridia bacterium]|nr:FHA domain-containing protein [Clostridia bacterium]
MNATCERPFSIGRDKNCDLVLNSEYVGNVHLRIGRDDMGYFAKDSSLNGSFVNDKVYRNESFSLEEGFVYIADVPVYFKRNENHSCLPVYPKYFRDDEKAEKAIESDGFNKTK